MNQKKLPGVETLGELVNRNIKATDDYIRQNCPQDQPYLYTPQGHGIVFKKLMGFERQKEC